MLAEATRMLISNFGVERESRFGKEQVTKMHLRFLELFLASHSNRGVI